MGPFGGKAIGLAWVTFVYPCLMLNYLGQGALLLEQPAAAANPFYLMAPEWGRLPLVAVATLACILGHAPGDPARLPAAAPDRAHQRQGRRADLYSGGQLDAADHDRASGARL